MLDAAQREAEPMIERTGLRGQLETPQGFWGSSRYAFGRG